jgi:hypothetical protein
LLTAPPIGGLAPRFWQIVLGTEPLVTEYLQTPGPWFDGSAAMAFALFHGIDYQRVPALRDQLKVDEVTFARALTETGHHAAVNRINFWTMPVQDAIDFAVFTAQVQVEMDRFLPGFGSVAGWLAPLWIAARRPRVIRRNLASLAGGRADHAGPIIL